MSASGSHESFRLVADMVPRAAELRRTAFCSASCTTLNRQIGRGFDPASVSRDGGLDLTSMRERLKLVAGELLIESQPALGTTIVARVPLPTGPATGHA